MTDPHEGLTREGFIKTGVQRDRVPPAYEPVIQAVSQAIKDLNLPPDDVSLYLYGSVATGTANPPSSDVDLLTIGLPPALTQPIALTLSNRFQNLCRRIEIAPATRADFERDTDESYGGRVFLRHYCLHLYGRVASLPTQSFPGDIQAARGFNGDIERDFHRWRTQIAQLPSQTLGYKVARKTLLAVASLISMHDHIWTTDRTPSARRYADIHPQWSLSLDMLLAWSAASATATPQELTDILAPTGFIHAVVEDFRSAIGLWP